LDLSGAYAAGIDDDPESWPAPDHVDFDGFIYGYLRKPDDARHRLELLRRQSLIGAENGEHQRVRAQPYRQLAKVLRDMGYEQEGRRTLIAFEEQRDLREHFNKPEKMLRWLYRKALRYGYEPHKPAAIIAVALFLAGWLFVSLGNRAGVMAPTAELTTLATVTHSQPSQLSPILYSLDALSPIHAFRQEENWWPRAESWRWCICWPTALPCGYLLRFWLCFEISAGWILTGLIVAGFTGIVRRE
jgi:hypothetical protein